MHSDFECAARTQYAGVSTRQVNESGALTPPPQAAHPHTVSAFTWPARPAARAAGWSRFIEVEK